MQELHLLLNETGSGVLELKLRGEVDMATVGPLREATRTATKAGTYECLVFDLEELTFMDSTGLHVLTEAHRHMKDRGGSIKVVCPHPNLRKLFEITGLSGVFDLHNTGGLAVAA